jgi:hypothetical protein
VATRVLPAALGRSLADVGDVHVDEVVVRLDLDVTAYDDETLAVLWADAIRAQVLAARRDPAPNIASRSPSRAPARVQVPGPLDVLADLRALAATGAGRGTPLPRGILALADSGTARAVADAAGPQEWPSLLRMLTRTLRPPRPARPPSQVLAASADMAEAVPPHFLAAPEAARTGPEERMADGADAVREVAALPHDRPGAVLDVLAVLAELMDEHATAVDTAAVTRVAGLVLMYPWLAEHCRRAEDLHPGIDGLEVREAALAAIVDPDPDLALALALADDTLVGVLAGRRSPGPSRIRLSLPRGEDVAESAVRVLTSFTSLLPGFERSSPAFVRASWIARLGVVDADRDPALLTAATHPLDVVLTRLPYPVSLVKLPWSPPLAVRFRP